MPLIEIQVLGLMLIMEAFAMIAMAILIIVSYFFDRKFAKSMAKIFVVGLVVFGGSYFVYSLESERYVFTVKSCEPDLTKNKVAVVIAKDGIYDNGEVSDHISAYFAAVKNDLNIDSAGVKKFEGKDMAGLSELDAFVEGLYKNDGVAYIILLGDDLPIGNVTNESTYAQYFKGIEVPRPIDDVGRELECVDYDCYARVPLDSNVPAPCKSNCKILHICSDIAVSIIVPPVAYSSEEKVNFVNKILETYAGYHNNFDPLRQIYPRSLLAIQDVIVNKKAEKFTGDTGYGLPMTLVFDNETARVESELKQKHMVMMLGTHGSRWGAGIGLLTEGYAVGYTTSERYLNFSRENGPPALIVESVACEATILKSDGIAHCCWPQIHMESGTWAYYSFGNLGDMLEGDVFNSFRNGVSNQETIGMAVRKNIRINNIIFGDILAHTK